MAMIGGSGACTDEVRATNAMRVQIPFPLMHVFAGELPKPRQRRAELLVLGIDHGVRPVGRDHAPGPATFANVAMVLESVHGRLRGGEHFDVESVEQGTR